MPRLSWLICVRNQDPMALMGCLALQKSLATGVEVEGLREDLETLGLVVTAFSAGDADTAA